MRHVTSFRTVLPIRTFAFLLLAALFTMAGLPRHAAAADAGGLVNALTSQLGVTKPQAEGGAGALFNLAKQRMAPDQFGQVQSQVPGIDGLMGASSGASQKSEFEQRRSGRNCDGRAWQRERRRRRRRTGSAGAAGRVLLVPRAVA